MPKEEIFIVDDSRSSLTFLSEIMSGAGYDVVCVQNGQDALKLLEKSHPDLILLDVDMPGMSGLELCAAIKSNLKFEHVPILFQSVLSDSNVRIDGLKFGAEDFLSKPYQPDEILLRVGIHLKLHALQTRLEQTVKERTEQLTNEVYERKLIEANLIESKQKLSNLTSHLQDVKEEERKRIAREIHDELGQSLSVAQIELKRLSSLFKPDQKEALDLVNQLGNSISLAANNARSISENLRPGMLDLLGLEPAIENHVTRFSQVTGLPCNLEISLPDDLELDDHFSIAVFRIVQESLTNVTKYAKASTVDVRLWGNQEGLVLMVQDDGIGFDVVSRKRNTAFGLLGMAERMEILGGELTIESSAELGTKVEAYFPIGEVDGDD